MEHIKVIELPHKSAQGAVYTLLHKVNEIVAWVNDHDERLKPVQGLETLPGGWISVEDRLPEVPLEYDCMEVLVYCKCPVRERMVIQLEFFWRDSTIYDEGCIPGFDIPGITHWMPLPSPPEAE